MPSALGERQRPQISAVEPDQIKGHIGGCPRVSEQVIELWPARFVGCEDLTVEYRVTTSREAAIWSPRPAKRLIRVPLREIMRQRPCSR